LNLSSLTFSGNLVICNITGSSWVANYAGKSASTPTISYGGGDVTLSGTLDRVRITTTSTDTLDAGVVNIVYE
jgi:hypothetical protein